MPPFPKPSLKPPACRPNRRRWTFTSLLVVAMLSMVLVGLGAFRLHVHWSPGEGASDELFTLLIRGGNVFDPLGAEAFGRVFWVDFCLTLALALALPWCRVLAASVVTLCTGAILLLVRAEHGAAAARMSVEFELLIVFVLFASYVLLSWYGETRDRKRFSELLGRYVPPELAAAYSRHPESMGLAGEAREISVMFCDVVDFSKVAESLEPEALAGWLNGFFELVSRVVVDHGGTIDKLMGDSLMAVWGAPAKSPSHPADALAAALEVQRELPALGQRYLAAGLPGIRAGIGLSSGRANVGPLGSVYRMDYTVVGDTVNVAQRLEAQTRRYGVPIIVSDKTVAALPERPFRELDTVRIKGRATPVTMYEPLEPAARADAAPIAPTRSGRVADIARAAARASPLRRPCPGGAAARRARG